MIFRDNLIISRVDGQVILLNLLTFRRKVFSAAYYDQFVRLVGKSVEEYTVEEQSLIAHLEEEKQILHPEEIKRWEDTIADYYVKTRSEERVIAPTLVVTDQCNSRCFYCIQKDLPHSTVMTEAHIDGVEDFYRQYAEWFHLRDTYEISITGGEPLLPGNFQVLQYIFKKWPGARLYLQTNGSHFPEMFQYLPISRIGGIKLSLDGPEMVHNRRRPAAGIENPFQRVITSIELALEHQIPVELKITVDLQSIMTLPGLVEFLEDRGWLRHPLISAGYTGVFSHSNGIRLDEKCNECHDMVKAIIALRQSHPEIRYFKNNVFYGLGKLLKTLRRPLNEQMIPEIYRCSILTNPNYTFDPWGNIYLCASFLGNESAKIGTYYPQISLDLERVQQLKDRNIFSLTKCRSCSYRFICRGGCPASAFLLEKENMAVDCGYYANRDVLDHLGKMFL